MLNFNVTKLLKCVRVREEDDPQVKKTFNFDHSRMIGVSIDSLTEITTVVLVVTSLRFQLLIFMEMCWDHATHYTVTLCKVVIPRHMCVCMSVSSNMTNNLTLAKIGKLEGEKRNDRKSRRHRKSLNGKCIWYRNFWSRSGFYSVKFVCRLILKWTIGRELPSILRSFLTSWLSEDNGQRTNNGNQRRSSRRKGIKLWLLT